MKTLDDYLRAQLDILSIGLNPSLNSVRAGYYFATPQNRFWKALNQSSLVDAVLTPGQAAQDRLLDEFRIGFTDVVKRPSKGAASLRAADFRRWAPDLNARLTRFAPRIAWFHGKIAYSSFLRYALDRRERPDWGEQPERLGGTTVFVSPNPSPANAAFALAELIHWFDELAALRDRLR